MSAPAPAAKAGPKPAAQEQEEAQRAEKSAEKGAQRPKPKPAPYRGSRSGGEFRSYAQAAQTAFATVRNLLSTLTASRISRGDPEPVPFPVNARPLSSGELQRELQQLQVAAIEASSAETTLKERVVEKVRASGDSKLDEEQQGTLDVVDRFFRSVVESPKLSEYAQERIRQLEVPVLKVVMRDPAFFDDMDSPVRGVMNRLAQLGAKGGRINPVVQRRVDELIQRIATCSCCQDMRSLMRSSSLSSKANRKEGRRW